ncbi:MAG: type transport system permease protein [Solirubrobacteraceae bacterium]|jgi:ABC-2 type transport system permease protein|nr:type transport system permease protein [Solirubrobacteraceae bacterium]
MTVVDERAMMIDLIREGGGQRIVGPAAFTGEVRRALNLTWTLAYLEFRLRFFGSVLGYLWQLLRPLAMFGVYYVVFTQFLPLSKDVPYYPPMLLAGIMLYQFFGDATGASVGAVLARENLVRKIHFPRIVIPFAVVVSAGLVLAVNMIAVGTFMFASGVPVRLNWLIAIPAVGLLVIYISGLCMLLSSLFVRYRDVQPIWDVVLQGSFYASPILYTIDRVPEKWQPLIMANPMSTAAEQIRHSVFDPNAPSAADALGGPIYLLIPIAISFGVFVLGVWYFNKTAPAVAEEL